MDRPRVAVKTKPIPVFYLVSALLAAMIVSSAAGMIFTFNSNENLVQYELENP